MPFDSYGISTQFINRFERLFSVNVRGTYIDDLFSYEFSEIEEPDSCGFGIVISGDPFFEEKRHRDAYHDKDTELLIGLNYIPIRNDLSNSKISSSSRVKETIITTGSTNQNHILIYKLKDSADL